MTTQNAVSIGLSAAKIELRAALSSLERVSSHDYTPHQAALIRGAQYQIERAGRITSQIYLKPPDKIIQQDVKLLPSPQKTQLPVEDIIDEN